MSRSWTARQRTYDPYEYAIPTRDEHMSASGAGARSRVANRSNTRYKEPVQVPTSKRNHRRREPIIIEGRIVSPRPLPDDVRIIDATRGSGVRAVRPTRRNQHTPRTTRDRDSGDRREYYSKDYHQRNPSVMYGIWNKFIGALTGNTRRKRHGQREVRYAMKVQDALRIAKNLEARDAEDPQYNRSLSDNKLRKSQRQAYGDQHRRQDTAYGAGKSPWTHGRRRTSSPVQGLPDVILGWFTGNKRRRRTGKAKDGGRRRR